MAPQATTDPYASIATPIQASAAPVVSAPAATDTSDPYASIATPIPNPKGTLAKVGDFVKGAGEGAVTAAGETIQSLPWVGKKLISPESMQAERSTFAPGSAGEKYGQTTGKIVEPVLEFVMGDEALQGLALADKIGLAGKIAKIAQDSPYIGKLLQHGVAAARMGTVGATEALAKGATPGQATAIGAATGIGGEALNVATDAVGSAGWLQRMNPFSAKAAAAVTAAPESTEPGVVQSLVKGADVAQAPAQEATRTAMKTGGAEVGLNTVQPAGLRTLAEEPINAVNGLKKGIYGQVDQAAGTDLKTLFGKLDAINDKIDLEASGSPEEARLEAQRTSQMQTIEDAKQVARSKGVNVDKLLDQGDDLHTREMALRDFQKGFLKNTGIVPGNATSGTPETINVDSAVKAAQKLQDNTKYGADGRLAQALGKDGAKKFLDDLYAAQRLGVKAMDTQALFGKILKGLEIAGLGGTIAGGAYALATK